MKDQNESWEQHRLDFLNTYGFTEGYAVITGKNQPQYMSVKETDKLKKSFEGMVSGTSPLLIDLQQIRQELGIEDLIFRKKDGVFVTDETGTLRYILAEDFPEFIENNVEYIPQPGRTITDRPEIEQILKKQSRVPTLPKDTFKAPDEPYDPNGDKSDIMISPPDMSHLHEEHK